LEADIAELLGTYTASAVKELFVIIADHSIPAAVRLKAITEVLDRGLGKASQQVNISGKVDHSHKHTHGVIVLPAIDTSPIIQLDNNGMPIQPLLDSTPIQVEPTIDDHSRINTNGLDITDGVIDE
jgi:hypothetical protein